MVELESQGELPRTEVAAFLRRFADEISDGSPDRDVRPADRDAPDEPFRADALEPKRITFIVGGESATVTVPDLVEFDVEVESRSPMFSSGVSQEIQFELSWKLEEADELRDDDRIEIG